MTKTEGAPHMKIANSPSDGNFRLVELDTRLPQAAADDRVEVYDPTRGRVVSFPGHLTPQGKIISSRDPNSQEPHVFPRTPWSARVTNTGLTSFRAETELPAALTMGSYWGRAAFSDDSAFLYLTGSFNSHSVHVTAVDAMGHLGSWRATTSMPPTPAGRRSLHQALVVSAHLYILGGWHTDGVPGLREIHRAPLAQDGSVGTFQLQATRLPFTAMAFSIALCGKRLYVARDDTIWVSEVKQGILSPFKAAAKEAFMKHENYGGTGVACSDKRLVVADETKTHILDLRSDGSLRLIRSLNNPAPFKRRTVFCHQGRFFVTTTHEGRIYKLSSPE